MMGYSTHIACERQITKHNINLVSGAGFKSHHPLSILDDRPYVFTTEKAPSEGAAKFSFGNLLRDI
jgi:hypothetical protein